MRQSEKRELIKQKLTDMPHLPDAIIAKVCECSRTTVWQMRKALSVQIEQVPANSEDSNFDWLSHPWVQQHPELVAAMDERSLRYCKRKEVLDELLANHRHKSPRAASARIKQREKAQRLVESGTPLTEKDIIIKQADLLSGLPWIRDESINLIITDLPYSRKSSYIKLYHALSELAGRVLVQGGSLLCMTGQTALPDKLTALCSDGRLRYHWMLSVVADRTSPCLHFIKVSARYKLVAHFTKGVFAGSLYSDLIKLETPPEQNKAHIWQQPVELTAELLRRFAVSRDITVLDPACGSSSTGIACVRFGCKYIGTDIDAESIRISKKRVLGELYAPHSSPAGVTPIISS